MRTAMMIIPPAKTRRASLVFGSPEKLKDYIRENYQGFYNGLMKISRDNEINGGGVEIIPFTLGETWFQDLVKYDNTASSRLLDLIVEHCHYNGIKPSMFYRIINKLKRHTL